MGMVAMSDKIAYIEDVKNIIKWVLQEMLWVKV